MVWARGYPASVADEDGAGDEVPVLGVLLDDELVQALAAARIRAAPAAAAAHRTVRFVLRITYSNLLINLIKECLLVLGKRLPLYLPTGSKAAQVPNGLSVGAFSHPRPAAARLRLNQ